MNAQTFKGEPLVLSAEKMLAQSENEIKQQVNSHFPDLADMFLIHMSLSGIPMPPKATNMNDFTKSIFDSLKVFLTRPNKGKGVHLVLAEIDSANLSVVIAVDESYEPSQSRVFGIPIRLNVMPVVIKGKEVAKMMPVDLLTKLKNELKLPDDLTYTFETFKSKTNPITGKAIEFTTSTVFLASDTFSREDSPDLDMVFVKETPTKVNVLIGASVIGAPFPFDAGVTK